MTRIVEQGPLAFGEFEQKQEDTMVLRNRLLLHGARLVHQETCGCRICREFFPLRARTERRIEGETDGV